MIFVGEKFAKSEIEGKNFLLSPRKRFIYHWNSKKMLDIKLLSMYRLIQL